LKNLLFIPCYNDTKNLRKLLIEINLIYKSKFDILVVNDGSVEEVLLIKKNKNIKIINLKYNYGIGFCLKFAIKYALENNYKKFCRIDSDGEHHPKYVGKIYKMLNINDFVIGNRKILFEQNYFKISSKRLINFIINKPFKLNIEDYNCGMMGLGVSAMKKIKNDYFINYPEPQIILKLLKANLKYSILTIKQRKRYSGSSSINFIKGLDFFLITLFFVLNRILNSSND
jgi:glycosyltransferase involved in cell wall biosynthesis